MTGIERLRQPTAILPLVVLRVAFGLLMFVSTLRFMGNGWIDKFYLQPDFHFTYYGFSWVKPLPGAGLYLVYGTVALLSLAIAVGLFYRVSMVAFFLLFTYTELLDKTYYLNHYYFISLLSFLLIFLPLHRAFSLDSRIWPALKTATVPSWTVAAVRLQVGLVYVFAGLAKLNYDWLFKAMPLKIWLVARTEVWLIGWFFTYPAAAYLLSWGGVVYDLTIVFFLLYRPTRPLAYLTVVGFHLMTAALFNIGMFPYIMIAATLIFFSAADFCWLTNQLLRLKSIIIRPLPENKGARVVLPGPSQTPTAEPDPTPSRLPPASPPYSLPLTSYFLLPTPYFLLPFFVIQIILPLRHWLYPGDVLWTEEGYRFAWKVMLAEKTGHVTFTVTDPVTGRSWLVFPGDYLTDQQEQQMSFQPDMILQFAHYLEQQLQAQGLAEVEVRAEAYVSRNGQPSRLLLDPTLDLTTQWDTFAPKSWILPE